MRLFYCPNVEVESVLSEEESRHAIKVLRLKKGDKIEILNGKGSSFVAQIMDEDAKKCNFKMISKKAHNLKEYSLDIIISPTKNADRVEWFVEKAIEIGVNKITLINTSRTERKKVRIDRLDKIAISAMKQSKTYFLPQITEVMTFKDVVEQPFDGQRFVAHCIEDDKRHLKSQLNLNGKYQILIGPEGDFTEDEIKLAIQNNFSAITLGENRLRTETAALYVCALANVLNA